MNIYRIILANLIAIIGLFAISCTKKQTALEQYIEQTNAQCPIPLLPNSESAFHGIELVDSMIMFSYSIAEHEIDWQYAHSNLRNEVENTLTSTLPEMQKLLNLMLDAKVGAYFHYQSTSDITKEIIITLTPTDILNLSQSNNQEEKRNKKFVNQVNQLLNQLPIELNEGTFLTHIAVSADSLLLSITFPEEVFMALKTQTPDDKLQTASEMRHELNKTVLKTLLNSNTSIKTIRLTCTGVTSQQQEVLNLTY